MDTPDDEQQPHEERFITMRDLYRDRDGNEVSEADYVPPPPPDSLNSLTYGDGVEVLPLTSTIFTEVEVLGGPSKRTDPNPLLEMILGDVKADIAEAEKEIREREEHATAPWRNLRVPTDIPPSSSTPPAAHVVVPAVRCVSDRTRPKS